jgi:hypothetical protein
MSNRTWLFGVASLAAGILLGHLVTRVCISAGPDARPKAERFQPGSATDGLALADLAFCHKISSFGNYLKFPIDEFTPGQEVLLYAELENAKSEATQDEQFHTTIKSTIKIYPEGDVDRVVEVIELPPTVDVCRKQRRDYFHSYQFTIRALPAGRYMLTLSLENPLDGNSASGSLPFAIR